MNNMTVVLLEDQLTREERQANDLRDAAMMILSTLGVTQDADTQVSSISLSIRRDGAVYATARLAVRKYINPNMTARRLNTAREES